MNRSEEAFPRGFSYADWLLFNYKRRSCGEEGRAKRRGKMSAMMDDIARIIASPISRRKALKLVGGTISGAVLASLGLGKAAFGLPLPYDAQQTQDQSGGDDHHKGCGKDEIACGKTCCDKDKQCCGDTCCDKEAVCCKNRCCRHDETCCGDRCCGKEAVCCKSRCCGREETCCGDHCCRADRVCCNNRCVKKSRSGSSPCSA